MTRRQSGNILFLILLAVVLFAALSYAITSSMRGGGQDAKAENYNLMASQIQQYGSSLSNTINRLMLVNGCSDTDIDFYGARYVTALTQNSYSSRATPDKCKLFHPDGGGLSPTTFESIIKVSGAWYDVIVGGTGIARVGLSCDNASCSELIWLIELPSTLNRKAFCDTYNRIAGAEGFKAVQMGINGSQIFNGAYTYAAGPVGGVNGNYTTLCAPYDGPYDTATRYFIYYVLLAR